MPKPLDRLDQLAEPSSPNHGCRFAVRGRYGGKRWLLSRPRCGGLVLGLENPPPVPVLDHEIVGLEDPEDMADLVATEILAVGILPDHLP